MVEKKTISNAIIIFLTRFGLFPIFSYDYDYYHRPDPEQEEKNEKGSTLDYCEGRFIIRYMWNSNCYRQEPSFAAHECEQHKQDNSNRMIEIIVAAAITEIIHILIY